LWWCSLLLTFLSPIFGERRIQRTVKVTVILKISGSIEVPVETLYIMIRLFAIIGLFSTLVYSK